MTKRSRNILVGAFVAVASFLALGAWLRKPGEDPDNQGGVAFALLALLVVLCVVIVKVTRAVGARFASPKPIEGPPPARDE